MITIASQITSLAVVYSNVYSDADQRKHQSSASLAFVWGIHRDRWIPRTKGQSRGKCFHLMTSSCWLEFSKVFLQKNAFENAAYNMPSILLRCHCLKYWIGIFNDDVSELWFYPYCILLLQILPLSSYNERAFLKVNMLRSIIHSIHR